MSKTCSKCNEIKPLDGFHKYKSGKFGVTSKCKECRKVESRAINNPKLIESKKCSVCGVNKKASEFYARRNAKNGCSSACKVCKEARDKERFRDPVKYIKLLHKTMRTNAKKRKLEVSIEIQELLDLYKAQNGICPLSKLKMETEQPHMDSRYDKPLFNISIDRIDSNKGYISGNVQLVCGIMNMMKTYLQQNEFIQYCKLIAGKITLSELNVNPVRYEATLKVENKEIIGPTKRCAKCTFFKSVEDFGNHSKTNDGYRTSCKECEKESRAINGAKLEQFVKRLYGTLLKNAKDRNIQVYITEQHIIKLYEKQHGLCNITKTLMTCITSMKGSFRGQKYLNNISIDRIDSIKSYTHDNIQLVSNIVNSMKWHLPQEKFIELCTIVANNN